MGMEGGAIAAMLPTVSTPTPLVQGRI